MGNKCPKCPESKNYGEIVDAKEEGGFHLLELHMPTAGVGIGAIGVFICIIIASVVCYRRMRKRQERRTQRQAHNQMLAGQPFGNVFGAYFNRAPGQQQQWDAFLARNRLPCLGNAAGLPSIDNGCHSCRPRRNSRREIGGHRSKRFSGGSYDNDRFTELTSGDEQQSQGKNGKRKPAGSKGRYHGDELP